MRKLTLVLLILFGFTSAYGMEGLQERASNLWRVIENWWYGQPDEAVRERYGQVLQDVKESVSREEAMRMKKQQRERKKELMEELIATEVSSVKKKLQKAPELHQAQILQFKALDPVLLRLLQVKIAGEVIDVANKPYDIISLGDNTLGYWNWDPVQGEWVRMTDKYPIIKPSQFVGWSTTQYHGLVYNDDPDTLVVVESSTHKKKWQRAGLGKRIVEHAATAKGEKYLVLTDEQPYIEIIDMENGKTVLKLKSEDKVVDGCLPFSMFNSDFSLVTVKNKQGENVSLDIYEIDSGKKIRSISIDNQVMDYRVKGNYISLSIKETEERGRVEIYDIHSGKKILTIQDVKHKEDGEEDVNFFVEWSSEDETSSSESSMSQCKKQDSESYDLDGAWSDKGKLFAATIIDGELSKVNLYNVKERKLLFSIAYAQSPDFYDNDQLLYVITKKNNLERTEFYDIATGKISMSVEGDLFGGALPLLAVIKENKVELYNIQTRSYLFSIDKKFTDIFDIPLVEQVADKIIVNDYRSQRGLNLIDIYSWNGNKIKSISTNRDPHWLMKSDDGQLGIIKFNLNPTTTVFYNVSTQATLQISHRDNEYIYNVLKGTNLIVDIINGGRILIYDVSSGKFDRIAQIDGVRSSIFSQQKFILSQMTDHTAHIYSLTTGEELMSFDNVKTAELTRDGNVLAVLTQDNNVELYLIPSRQKILSLSGRVMAADSDTLAILQGEGENQKLIVFDLDKLLRLYQQLNHIKNIQQYELLEGFAQAIKDTARIHANEAQWQLFKSLPQDIQDALKLYIQSPLSPQEQRREQQLEALKKRGVTKD